MMKKIMIVIIMSVLSLFIFNQSVSADTILTPEPDSFTGGLWHVEDGNRVYVFMKYNDGDIEGDHVIETGSVSNESYPDFDYSTYTYWPDFREYDFNFPNTSLYDDYAALSNPNPAIYDRFVVEIIANMTSEYGLEPSYKEIRSYSSSIDEITINLFEKNELDCFFDYSYIKLSVDGEEILSSRQLSEAQASNCEIPDEANPNYQDLAFGVRMYWEQSTTADVIDPGTTENPWEALPDTTGSPVIPYGNFGSVSDITVDNQNISFNVNYLGTTYPVSSFTVEGDLDFISESNDVLYYSDPITDDRILYFNFGETLDSAILAARTFATVEEWKGEALWNLTQNEIKVTGVKTVYNYIPEVDDDDGNVYSYFYMPDVEMDSLISVSAVLAYRYWDEAWFGLGDPEPGEIQFKNVAAVRGETTSVNPTWVEDTYNLAYIFSGVAVVATATGMFVPIYGWGVSGAFFLIGGALQISDINEWFAYDVEQIQNVIPSVALTNEINTYISETSGDDQFTADTDKLYKLHLATLQDYDDVEVMKELSNVTQVVWETDGEIYVVNEDYIVDYWFGPGTLPPPSPPGSDKEIKLVLGAFGGVLGLYFLSSLKLHKKPFLLFIIVAAVAYVLYELGLI